VMIQSAGSGRGPATFFANAAGKRGRQSTVFSPAGFSMELAANTPP
jgi:hypothetical protein